MPSRSASKKLKELERKRVEAAAADHSEEEEESEGEEVRAPVAFNAFALLNGDDEEEEVEEEEEEEGKGEEEKESEEGPAKNGDIKQYMVDLAVLREASNHSDRGGAANGGSSGSSKSKKKKKNKKKNKSKKGGSGGGEDEEGGVDGTTANVEDLLEYINGESAERPSSLATTSSGFASGKSVFSVLRLRREDLNSEKELARKFGKRVVRGVENESAAENRSRAGRNRILQRYPNIATSFQRERCRTFVTAKEDYFVAKGAGLKMEKKVEKDGVTYFSYQVGGEYARAQESFAMCVESYSPDNLLRLAQTQPYHVDTLLQLAELQARTGEAENALPTIERVLFILEASFHPSFRPWDGDGLCRMKLEDGCNASFFVAVWRYLHLVARRGSLETAYSLCKLLLLINPTSDPMGVRLCLDYYGIRARQYEEVIEYVEVFATSNDKNMLFFLPNLLFTRALSLFHLKGKEEEGAPDLSPIDDKRTGDLLSVNASAQMRRAMMLFPATAKKLMSAVSSFCANLPFFDKAVFDHAGVERVTRFFVERSSGLFNSADVKGWMEDCAKQVNEDCSSSSPSPIARRMNELRLGYSPDDMYSSVYSHLSLADFSDKIETVPEELRMPLRNPADLAAAVQHPPRRYAQPLNVHDHPLRVFLNSLLPWYSVEGAAAAQRQDMQQAVEQARAAVGELPFSPDMLSDLNEDELSADLIHSLFALGGQGRGGGEQREGEGHDTLE